MYATPHGHDDEGGGGGGGGGGMTDDAAGPFCCQATILALVAGNYVTIALLPVVQLTASAAQRSETIASKY